MNQLPSIGARAATPRVGRPPRVYQDGRYCTKEGCTTVLSIYNGGKFCYNHLPVKRPRLRGAMPSETMEKEARMPRCASCGQRARRWAPNSGDTVVEGVIHREGFAGRATLCEDPN